MKNANWMFFSLSLLIGVAQAQEAELQSKHEFLRNRYGAAAAPADAASLIGAYIGHCVKHGVPTQNDFRGIEFYGESSTALYVGQFENINGQKEVLPIRSDFFNAPELNPPGPVQNWDSVAQFVKQGASNTDNSYGMNSPGLYAYTARFESGAWVLLTPTPDQSHDHDEFGNPPVLTACRSGSLGYIGCVLKNHSDSFRVLPNQRLISKRVSQGWTGVRGDEETYCEWTPIASQSRVPAVYR